MAHYLLLGTTANNWRLHVSEDPADVTERLRTADGPVSVAAVSQDQIEPTQVWVNPLRLGWWAIVELPDPD